MKFIGEESAAKRAFDSDSHRRAAGKMSWIRDTNSRGYSNETPKNPNQSEGREHHAEGDAAGCHDDESAKRSSHLRGDYARTPRGDYGGTGYKSGGSPGDDKRQGHHRGGNPGEAALYSDTHKKGGTPGDDERTHHSVGGTAKKIFSWMNPYGLAKHAYDAAKGDKRGGAAGMDDGGDVPGQPYKKGDQVSEDEWKARRKAAGLDRGGNNPDAVYDREHHAKGDKTGLPWPFAHYPK